MHDIVGVIFEFTVLIVFDIFTLFPKFRLIGDLVLLAQVDFDVRHERIEIFVLELELYIVIRSEISFVNQVNRSSLFYL